MQVGLPAANDLDPCAKFTRQNRTSREESGVELLSAIGEFTHGRRTDKANLGIDGFWFTYQQRKRFAAREWCHDTKKAWVG